LERRFNHFQRTMKEVPRLESTSLLGFCRPTAPDELRTSRNIHSSTGHRLTGPLVNRYLSIGVRHAF